MISSAREPHGDPIEDFAFEEFMTRSVSLPLLSLPLVEGEREDESDNDKEGSDNEREGEGVEEGLLPSPPQHNQQQPSQPSLLHSHSQYPQTQLHNTSQQPPAKKSSSTSSLQAQAAIKKIPKFLRNTPYFAAYCKHTLGAVEGSATAVSTGIPPNQAEPQVQPAFRVDAPVEKRGTHNTVTASKKDLIAAVNHQHNNNPIGMLPAQFDPNDIANNS